MTTATKTGGKMRHSSEDHYIACGCRSAGECNHNIFCEQKAIDACVADFAAQLNAKLQSKRHQGRSGWDNPLWPREEIIRQLRDHIDKGDMLDVAAFAMFAWNQGSDAASMPNNGVATS